MPIQRTIARSLLAGTVLGATAIPALAQEGPPQAQHETSFALSASGAYAVAGPLSGPATAFQALWTPSPHWGFGLAADVAVLSDQGTTRNGLHYEFQQLSAQFGPVVQFRLPIGMFTPFAELSGGYTAAPLGTNENAQCEYASGIGLGAGAGLRASLGSRVDVGARWGMRLPGAGVTCTDAEGPFGFDFSFVQTFGAAVDVRF